MKTRKLPRPPIPDLDSINPDSVTEAQAAQVIAACIAQGMKADYFAMLMNTMNPDKVKAAATMTLHELSDEFRHDQAARDILDQLPQFPQFCADLHRAARALYPNLECQANSDQTQPAPNAETHS